MFQHTNLRSYLFACSPWAGIKCIIAHVLTGHRRVNKMDEKYKFAYFMTLENVRSERGINIMQIDWNKWPPYAMHGAGCSKVVVSGWTRFDERNVFWKITIGIEARTFHIKKIENFYSELVFRWFTSHTVGESVQPLEEAGNEPPFGISFFEYIHSKRVGFLAAWRIEMTFLKMSIIRMIERRIFQ